MYKKICRVLFAASVFVITWFPINSLQIASSYQAFPYFNQTPDVVSLMRGYYKNFSALAESIKKAQTYSDVESSVNDLLNSTPLLAIPSGGLFGLENSEIFKAILDEYVKRGGIIIVFAQQHGYEPGILPVPQEADGSFKQITGYGWAEDQSCFYRAAYIDTYHQLLSGQSNATPSLNMDGYFTNYPSNSTILLRRTANGQPAMLMYDYGQGKVIVTSMYPEVANVTGQTSAEEKALVRDMISWAKAPTTLPEIKPGETVSLTVSVQNNTTTDAASAKLQIYNPDRTMLLSEQTVTASIPAGQSTTIPVSYATATNSPLGIYHIDYILLDSAGNVIQAQAEADSGRFVVSNPPSQIISKPLTFSVTAPTEHFLIDSDATFTWHIWNNSDVEKTVTVRYGFPHHTWETGDSSYGNFQDLSKILTVAAKSETTFTHTIVVKTEDQLFSNLYDENNTLISRSNFKIWKIFPSVNITVQTDKATYAKGEIVNLTLNIQNKQNASYTATLKVRVSDPLNASAYSTSLDVNLPASGTVTQNLSFALPTTTLPGFYTVLVDAYDVNGKKIGENSTRFELPKSLLSIASTLPSVFGVNNSISFNMENKGVMPVSLATLSTSLGDPSGTEIWNEQKQIAPLQPGQSTVIDLSMPITNPAFGNYRLTYSLSYDGQTNGGEIIISNTDTIVPSFDKPSYRVRETANLTVDLANTGRFNQDNFSVTVSAPDANYADTKTISLGQGQALSLQYAIPIPETIQAGVHDVNITLTLPSGSSLIQNTKMLVPESNLTITGPAVTQFNAGDTINIDVSNTGGVDTNTTYKVSLTGNGGTIYQNTISDAIQSSLSKAYNFQIPLQATTGSYNLFAEILDTKTNKKTYFNKAFAITGISAGLSVKTDKDIYLYTENINALSQISNQAYAIDNANLHLQIVNKCSWWGEEASYHISTWDGVSWIERGVLHYPNTLETQLIDLSAYLPDAAGEYKVRIRQVGVDDARIDYITLMADGAAYTPTSAMSLTTNNNILDAITTADSWTAYVLNNEIEIQWAGVPTSTNKILLMRALEGAINYSSCQERTYWQTDVPITQAANTTVNLNNLVNPFYDTGQFFLQGTLTSRTGQIIAQAEYPFNVIDGDIALRLNTDKAIYKPGETVTITGEAINIATIEATGITAEVYDNNWSTIYTGTFNIPANGTQAFTFTTSAGSEGIYQLNAYAYQNTNYLTSSADKYEVASAVISASANAPEIVGRIPFELDITINNTGRVQATVQLSVSGGSLAATQTIILQPNETRLLQYNQSITQDTAYTINITGDLNQAITIPVVYGEGVGIALNTQALYPEGKVAIPANITNTGQIDESISIAFSLQPSGLTQTKTYYIPKGGSVTDTLYYDLTEGSYQLSAVSSQPQATASANFSVRKENKVEMTTLVGQQTNGLIPVSLTVTNLGYNAINGSLQLSVISGQNAVVWNGEQTITQLATGNSQLVTFNINPSVIQPGNYTLRAELLNNSNQQFAQNTQPLSITGPTFQLTELPSYQTFNPGQEALFTFKVKNTGNQEGAVELNFKAYDLIDSTMREWLMPNEEKTITFNLLMPTDLEEKDYFAEYEMKAIIGQPSANSKGQIKYHLAGINLNVNASLDKQNYNIGDTARLTINITQQSALSSQNLFARVNYAGYENQQAFTLNGSQTLTFDIPLTQITGEKLFYGIYHESGRSIHLNSLYLYKAGDVITITTDKQVYNPGEVVSATLSGNAFGQMTLTGPGGYTEAFAFTGTAAKGIALPLTMAAGTYFINAQLSASTGQVYTANHPIDVAGIQVKVKEAILDKAKYQSQDNMNLSLTIETNQNLASTLKAWVVDPEGKYTAIGENGINLISAEPLLTNNSYSLSTTVSGIHRLVYGIYSGDLLLSSGSEAFDVGDAVLLGISTNKTDYGTNTEPINVKASIYGTGGSNLEIQIDGTTVKTEPVALSGFTTLNIDIGTVNSGAHTIKGILATNGLTSTKQTGFVYGSNLPDLTASISTHPSAITGTTMPVIITIMNQGKTSSAATTISLYDGDNLIESKPTNALNPGEMQEITFTWNVLGKAGAHNIKATVDPNNQVIEYNETNNTAIAAITIPDITMNISTDAETYRTNKNIGINTAITNLTPSTNYQDIILNTEIRNPSGLTIYTKADTITLLPASTSTNYITAWNTESNNAGTYTIRQTTTAGQIIIVKEKQITIDQTTEFSGSITPDTQIIFKGKDLKANYTITNIGNTEINNQKLQIAITDAITKEVLKQAEIPFSLKIKETISGTATISQIDLEPKEYNLNLTALIDNTTYTIATTSITVKLPLQITKGIGVWPRVLVYIQDKEKEHNEKGEKDNTKEQIANLLTTMGINNTIVTKEEDFITQFRTGKHNIYMIIEARPEQDNHGANGQGSENIGQQYIWKEMTEAINNGEGLIYIKTKPDEKPDLREVLGVKIKGEEKHAKQLILLESPIANANTIDLTQEKAIQITLEKAAPAAYINTKDYMEHNEKEEQIPAITINKYGLGKAILFAFNPIDNNNPILNQVIINAINYITPDAEKTELTTNSIAPINTRIMNLGEEIALRITELLPEGVKLIEAYKPTSTEPLTWETTLKPNEARDIRYIIQLPDKTGAYELTSRIEYQQNGIYKNYGDTILTFDIKRDFTKILEDAINNINKLNLTGEDTEKAEEVKELINNVINRGIDNKEKLIDNIRDLTKAVERLNKINADTFHIRLDIDMALRIVEMKIGRE